MFNTAWAGSRSHGPVDPVGTNRAALIALAAEAKRCERGSGWLSATKIQVRFQAILDEEATAFLGRSWYELTTGSR